MSSSAIKALMQTDCDLQENCTVLAPLFLAVINSYTQQKPVTILVGPDRVRFFVHEALFAAESPFLRVVFKDCWDRGKGVVEISSISSIGVGIVVGWIDSKQLLDRLRT